MKQPKTFWGETLNITVHVLNMSPAVALKGNVHNQVWTCKEVSYEHLHVFGCKAFVHIPKDERSKLDAKTRQYVFIGYSHDDFGYKLYDPVENKIVRSRDVVFVEDQTIENIRKEMKTMPQ